MAKKRINNYKFKPGIGYSENSYPNAYSLLNQNRAFLASEAVAYINQQVSAATQIQTDIGYIIDGVAFDVALGTNFNAVWFGRAESLSGNISKTEERRLTRVKTQVAALTDVSADATSLSRSNAAFTEIADVMSNGVGSADTVTVTNPTDATASRIAAKDRILNNLTFLRNEIIAWTNVNYPAYDTTQTHGISSGCIDVQYVIEAAAYDVLYGGNSASYNHAKYFPNYVTSGLIISGTHQTHVVAAYGRLKTIISQVILGTSVTVSSGNATSQNTAGSNGASAEATKASNMIDITSDVLETGSSTLDALTKTVPTITWATTAIQTAKSAIDTNKTSVINATCWTTGYTYNQTKCERDVGLVLSAYLYDLRYGGNSKTYKYAKKYWDGDVSQLDGNRMPEIDTHAHLGDLITDFVFTETTYTKLGSVDQVTDATIVYETAASTRIDTLVTLLTGVITTGLSALPTFEDTGVGYVKFIGNYDSADILLITNTTNNEIVYTFNETTKGGLTEISRGFIGPNSGNQYYADEDFKKFLQVTDAVTTVQLNYSTATCLATDELQIYVDTDELIVRPFEFGTDAIERMRIAPPLSMLDADFEYGLQPTKWSAIATMRGYPSVYEVPGTEQPVQRAVTDSSAGTAGVGASLITIYTAGAHNLIVGDAITIKSFNQSIIGTARAEGAFIIVDVASTTQFSYYAKAKVGTSGNIDIHIESTQLRKAAFYTGADIGVNPVISVQSNGSSGVINPALTVPTGSDIIPFTVVSGLAPETGAPLTAAGIPTGAQVTGKVGSGGIIVTPVMTADTVVGSTAIQVQSTTGIAAGQAINRGDGEAVVVNTVVGNDVNLSGAITTDFKGNLVTYNDVSGTNVTSLGNGLRLDISRASGSYSLDAISHSGNDYQVGDQLIIAGDNLGGTSPANDCDITVDSVDTGGEVLTLTLSGTAFNGTGNFSAVSNTYNHGNGNGGTWNVTYAGNAYSATQIDPTFNNQTGTVSGGAGTGAIWNLTSTNNNYALTIDPNEIGVTGYAPYDIIKIAGTDLGGATPDNDAQISIVSANSLGFPTGFSVAGVGADAVNNYIGPAWSTPQSGVGAAFNVTQTGTNYAVTVTQIGSGFAGGNTVTIAGTALGGTSPANDCTITIDTVDTGGEILTVTPSGTAYNFKEYNNVSTGQNLVGSGAQFNVSISGQTYSATLVAGGDNYAPNQTITIAGTSLGGTSPTHDLVLTITDVDNDSTLTAGPVLTMNASGTAQRSTSGYVVADRIKIPGGNFPTGVNGTNDVIMRVDSVGTGGYITGVTVSGTAPDGTQVYNAVAASGGAGSSATFDVTRTGSVYTANVNNAGTNYVGGNSLTILGNLLGGATPANDCTITVDTVDGSGVIQTITVSGAAANVGSVDNLSSENIIGSGATFDVALAGGSYTVTIAGAGNNYYDDQTFTVLGTSVAGSTPTNDVTIIVTNTGASNGITSVSSSGTGSTDVASFDYITVSNASATGNAATFNILRDGTSADSTVGTYTISGSNPGNGYSVGNRLAINGGTVGGTPTTNDIEITVDSVDSAGAIVTFSATGDAYAGDDFALYSTVTMDSITTAPLATSLAISFSALATLRITFQNPHGLVPGDTFLTTIQTDNGTNNHNLAAGAFLAINVPSKTVLDYTARAVGTIDTSADTLKGSVYPRPDSFFIHRPYDGGVQLGTGGPQHGAQAIRQSKKYIRYQSGKGIMYTTGALFAPSYDLRSVTSSGVEIGSTVTITTDDNDHGLQIGAQIELIGIETPGYNGTYTINDVTDERTVTALSVYRLGATTAVLSFGAQLSTKSWHGATVRSGVFDDQNGIFWEYDGTNLLVAQRTSTKQISGTSTISPDTNILSGSNTRFTEQLKAGDRIVIRGMTHVVTFVNSDTSVNVTPDYRGVNTAQGAKVCLVADKKVRQSDFNLDRMDGTGPSGYDFKPSKMQMIGIEYSWYGAGFIDFMVRGADGNFVYAHRMRNSNVNTEAFMRSGNLPVRYEITNEGQNGKLAAQMLPSDTTATLVDVDFFPDAGTIYVNDEIMTYTGRDETNNTLTGITRTANLVNFQAGAQRTYTGNTTAGTHTNRTGVVLISNTCTPLISHWGSAFITDGGFDEDRGYIFSYTEPNINISTTKQTAFLIRLAPSVSNAIIGDLGDRELLNRAQLLLQGLEVTSESSTGSIVVEGVLNPKNYPANPSNITWVGLATEAQGGQPSFAQVASGGSVTWTDDISSTTANITAQSVMTGTAITNDRMRNQAILWMRYDGGNGTSDIGLEAGDKFTATSGPSTVPANTTVTNVSAPYFFNGNQEVAVNLSSNFNGTIQVGETMTFTRGGTLGNSNYMLATQLSWEASNAAVGTAVTATSAGSFPSNTQIQNVTQKTFASTVYYEVTFNNAYSGNLTAGSGTITVTFTNPVYAQPGENILSFIAVPGEKAEIDLGDLKELTNTTLGGRGTFPNGPDVLAINIYKTAGSDVQGNMILRWGEAQA